jgi:hypothetical protein
VVHCETEAVKALCFIAREYGDVVGRIRAKDTRLKLLPLKTKGLSPLLERRKGRIGTRKGRWGGGEREGVRADRNGCEQVGPLTADTSKGFPFAFHTCQSLCTIGSCRMMSVDATCEISLAQVSRRCVLAHPNPFSARSYARE